MGATLGSYEIARSGMYVNERSLTVTGHNLANASTPGYVRQQAIIATSRYSMENHKFQVGQGAQIEQTRQIRHTFLDTIYRKESTAYGYWNARSKAFDDMETIMGDPAMTGVDGDTNVSGLQQVMNQFWDSWQELTKDPSSLTVRSLVRQRSVTLVDQVNHIGRQLDELQNNLNNEIKVRTGEVNTITSQIAKLNTEIVNYEVNGDHANDLRDQRNALIDQLSNLANVDVQEMSGGWVYVTLGGNILVNRGISTDIYLDKSTTYAPFYVPKLAGTGQEIAFGGGTIKGLLDSRGESFYCQGETAVNAKNPNDIKSMSVSELKGLLNTLVRNLAEKINGQHASGLDLNGNAGLPLFEKVNASLEFGAGNIKLNSAIEQDANKIVASKTGEKEENTIARYIANFRNEKIFGTTGQEVSTDEYYNKLIMSLGANGQEAASNTKSQLILVQSSDNARNAISGVAMDEEMSSMMKFQFAYGAASRLFNVVDDMIETVISRMGLVGR